MASHGRSFKISFSSWSPRKASDLGHHQLAPSTDETIFNSIPWVANLLSCPYPSHLRRPSTTMLCRLCFRAGLRKPSAPPSIYPAITPPRSSVPQRLLSRTSTLLPPSIELRSAVLRMPSSRTPPTSATTAPFRSRRCFSSPAESLATEPAQQQDAPRLEKPDFLNDAESVIWDRLVVEFAPTELLVQDISGGCGSMYGIEVSSEKFRGANMLKQQRMVNSILGDLMKDWHGVQLKTRVP